MPSWPIHLALAKKINKKFKYGDEFIIANVMPDVLQGFMIKNPSQIILKNISHSQEENTKPIIINIDKFLNKYKNDLKNSIVIGYLVHLITDKYFNEYTYKNHYLIENNEQKIILNDNTIIKPNIKAWQIKQADFKNYDQKLINKNMLPKIKNDIKIDKFKIIKECPINADDLIKTINKINILQTNKQEYNKNKYHMFTEKELDKIYNNCYKYIINFLNKI